MSKPPDFFTKEHSRAYDERNAKLSAISENMHFLIRLVLKDLPAKSRVLCVGVGTGAEIMSLAREYPEWTFVGVDPSQSMLDVCAERLRAAGFADRCKLVNGFVHDVSDSDFDASLSVLVGHFVKRDERLAFYENLVHRLRSGGVVVDTEISYDLESTEFPSMLANWTKIQALMGGTSESLATLPQVLKEVLTVLPPTEIESLLLDAGVAKPVRFFQAFMITGWYGVRA